MHTPELVICTEPTPGEVQYLEHRLYEFNSAATGITDGEWLGGSGRSPARSQEHAPAQAPWHSQLTPQ
jgi:hypothetical protein